MPYSIRMAGVPDLGAMHAGALKFYSSSRFLENFDIDRFTAVWTQLLQSGTGVIFLIEEGGEIHGAIGGIVHQDLYGDTLVAEEFFWFVKPEFRGGGVRLYIAFEKWARECGASSIQMVHLADVMPDKVAAFYRRMGFIPVETRYSKGLA